MAELGEAVLTIRVDSQTAQQQINAFRQEITRTLGDVGEINFGGLERSARQSGERAGRALAQGVTQATQGLRFESIEEALNFSGALNGTLRDLRTYRGALEALRDVTQATTPGFYQLNDVIAATGEAIRNYSASTDQLVDAALRTRVRELTAQLREQREEAAANARVDREWVQAIRTIEGAQRNAAAATRLANQAFRDQVAAVGSLARKGAGDVAGAVGAVGKGIGAAASGAVKAGRIGYNIGAEFGIFEEPKVGPIKTAIQQVIDRFKFLGEQATTTRGIILRSLEGAGAGAALIKIAENADQLRQALNGVSVASKATEAATSGFSKVGQYLADAFNQGGWLTDNGNTIIGKILNLSAAAEQGAAATTGFADRLIQLGAGGLGAGLDAVEALVKGFSSLSPAAQVAALSVPAVFAAFSGPLSAKAKEELNKILSQLDQIQSRAIGVTAGLSQAINELGKAEFDAQPKLLPPAKENPIDDSVAAQRQLVNEQTTSKNVEEALNTSRERGLRFLEKQTAEQRRLIDQGLQLQPLSGSPVVQRTNLLPPGAPASSLPNPNQYSRPIGPEESAQKVAERRQAQLADDLADVTARRLVIEQSILDLQEATRTAVARQEKQARAVAEFGASPIDGRLRDGTLVPGSPAFRKDRARRRSDAAGSALIGGAFPLLFGQGLGASIGGGIGGAGGGFLGGQFGFGLSLVGTAVGAQFDQASQKLQTLGSALSDPISKFGELQQAGLLSSKGLERQIQALIDTGRQAEAAALIQQDLATTYGDLKTAQELARQADELNRSWSRLTVTLASFAVGPLAQAIGDTSDGLQGFTQVVQRLGEIIANIPKLPNVLPAPLQLPQPVQERVNQRIGGSLQTGILNLLNPLKPIFDLGSGLGGLFGSGKDKPATSSATSANAEASKKARQDLLAITRQLISSEAQNNTVLSLGLKLRQSQLQEARAIANLTETDPKARQVRVEEIQRAAKEERADLREQAREAERSGIRDLNRARQLVGVYGFQRQIKEEQLKLDEASRVAEQAQRAYNASPTKDKGEANALNAAILTRRRVEIETAERIQQINFEQAKANEAALKGLVSASEQAKKNLIEGFNAVQAASRSLKDAKLVLAEKQNTSGEGVNKYLSPEAVAQRQEKANAYLTRRAQKAVNDFSVREGIPVDITVTGSTEQRNAELIEVIKAFEGENRAIEDIAKINRDLVVATQELTVATKSTAEAIAQALPGLADGIQALAVKNWLVNVNVPTKNYNTPLPGF